MKLETGRSGRRSTQVCRKFFGRPLWILCAVSIVLRGLLVDASEQTTGSSSGTVITNSIGLRVILIPSGSFRMGAEENEEGSRIDERPVHEEKITKPFYLGVYEVTQEEYEKVVGTNPSCFSSTGEGQTKIQGLDTKRFPVEQVSWIEANEFCNKLNSLPEEVAAGRKYRLPTEAEWQYACRAGSTTPFHYGKGLGSADANINGVFPYGGAPRGPFLGRTAPVGSYKPNAFGLYDMHGNVSEMVNDWYARFYFKESPSEDPLGPMNGADRVVLGGSWGTDAARCRSAFRRSNATSGKARYFGFRVACEITKP
ncbi:MAG: formylglycine-generating enzyme family protein [Planctomycetes bacterium]|nr:formylglycine-generating enzyme family protein [Planctomycetota bacterium]